MLSTWTKINPTQNCFRFYVISLTHDLFNEYVVSCEWGRIGAKGTHRKVDIFTSFDEALVRVKRIEALRVKHHYHESAS